jgi:putative DNA primase/helicase
MASAAAEAVLAAALSAPRLAPQHAALLERSAITPEVVAARGYRTVTIATELRRLGFSGAQARVPALLVPVWTVHGEIGLYQNRPDSPRVRDGKPLKYETPCGARMVLDVPPAAHAALGNPKLPLFVTEGVRKADAAVSVGLCCVALLGVWNWRGSNAHGGKVALPDWESVALNGRAVYIVFDSDIAEKRAVRAALIRLKAFLESRGGAVRLVYLAPGAGGAKVGLDDFLAAGGTVEQLLALAADEVRSVRPADSNASHEPQGAVKHPFRLMPAGVEYAEEGEEGATEWARVCSHLEVLALARDGEGRDWGRLLRLTDPDAGLHEWCMPASMLASDGTDYRRELLALGLRLSAGPKARHRLHEYITDTLPKERARSVARIGWHPTPSGNVYVLPDHTFGATGERVLLQTETATEHAMRCAGSLADWQQHVAAPCAGNSRLVFALSCAFTGPLLYIAREEGGGFHLRGPSSIGKTTALRVAASAWGGGGVGGYLRTWRATANGLEGLAEMHCDALLPLDEMSQVNGREAGEVAYMLANGSGKSRASRDGSARRVAQWRLLFLSTGELSLAEKMNEAGQRARAGQETRLVDVPADAGAGFGLFEDLRGLPTAAGFARELCDASARFYGVAIREFLARLTTNLEGLSEALTTARKRWVSAHCPSDADGQVQRVAARFGLVAAAGELASTMDVVPWVDGEADKAAARCFEAWVSARGGTGAAEIAAGLAQVRRFFELHAESRFSPWRTDNGEPERATINRAGFRRDDGTGLEFLVLPIAWKSEICAGLDAHALANELKARGVLIPDASDGKLQSRHRLPGLSTKRVYRVTAAILSDGSDDA